MVPQKHLLAFLGIVVISFSLRGPLTGVSPLVSLMKSELGLNHTLIGLVTTLPLLMFAVCSPMVSWFTRHFGSARTMFAGLLFLVAGECLRGLGGLALLFSGTVTTTALPDSVSSTRTKSRFGSSSRSIRSRSTREESACRHAAAVSNNNRIVFFIWSFLSVVVIEFLSADRSSRGERNMRPDSWPNHHIAERSGGSNR